MNLTNAVTGPQGLLSRSTDLLRGRAGHFLDMTMAAMIAFAIGWAACFYWYDVNSLKGQTALRGQELHTYQKVVGPLQ